MKLTKSAALVVAGFLIVACSEQERSSEERMIEDSATMDSAVQEIVPTAEELQQQGNEIVDAALEGGADAIQGGVSTLDEAKTAAGQMVEEELDEFAQKLQDEREDLEKDLGKQMGQ